MQARSPNPRDPHGDAEGLVLDPKQLHLSASSLILVKNIADTLERKYPGWLWAVNADERGGIVNIFSARLSLRLGYTLHLKDVQEDPRMKHAMRAGGELLDRFGYRRGAFNVEKFRAGKRNLGVPVADVSDWNKKGQRDYRTRELAAAVDEGRARILMDADIARARAAARVAQ